MNILPRRVLDCSFDQLLSLRTTGRYLYASLAVNMLLQAGFMSYKLAETMYTNEWSDMGFAGLVASYTMWIVISTAGGLFGLYSAHQFDSTTALYCLYAWVALALFQTVEAFVAMVFLAPDVLNTMDATESLLWNTASLLAIEVLFIGFIAAYIQLLDLCEPGKALQAQEGKHLVEEALLSPVVSNHVTPYGTESAAFAI
ncbi:hypothetical protein DYB32_007350 [Aphanomyces invadans]|uniref:Uncharacterized protein n=1 Tax=Aphanomyces invadans TaxID=157072 RepID=A0A418ANQ9_9STRA|nr:hypothetical protein DYB32_007350 [Aphanomyces invadans]